MFECVEQRDRKADRTVNNQQKTLSFRADAYTPTAVPGICVCAHLSFVWSRKK